MKTTKYVAILVCMLGLTNCNDGFLDKIPMDEMTDASFWANESDAVQYTTGLYHYLMPPVDDVVLTDSYTDNAVPVHLHDPQGDISGGTLTSTNGFVANAWWYCYESIRRCNIFFQNIENCPMDAELKERLIGETQFLRAYAYADLVRRWGGVPLLTTPLELNEPIPARSSAEEIYDFIIDELEQAKDKLPLSYDEANIGRATRGAALSLEAIIHLFFGNYAEAEKAAKAVMDLGVYSLYQGGYRQLFLPENKNNKEVIFDHQYMRELYTYTIDQAYLPAMCGGWTVMSPTQDLVDAYECTDGLTIEESPLFDPMNEFENRDPRLEQSILWNGREFAGKIYNTFSGVDKLGASNATRTGYCLHKWIDPNNDGVTEGSWGNFIYIRYAEILLTYAEAHTRVSGVDQSVYDAINAIRARETVNMPPLPAGLSQEEMLEAILRERRVELTFEGKRLFDIRRLRIAEEALTKPVYGQMENGAHIYIETRKFDPNIHYLWPIPQTEIDLSHGTIEQNPGY